MAEQWKPVTGFPDYEVSNKGRVRSLKHKVPRIMAPGGVRYPHVTLSKDGVATTHTVHKLVAIEFVPGREDGLIVCHGPAKGENRNAAANLRWDTVSANAIDASRLGDIPRQVLSETEVREIRRLYEEGNHSHRSLSKLFGVTHQAIRDLLIRKNYRWVA